MILGTGSVYGSMQRVQAQLISNVGFKVSLRKLYLALFLKDRFN